MYRRVSTQKAPMEVDPNNPIVKLCAEGITAEMAGRKDEAANLYREAWETRSNDFEACIAAHYVARVQTTAVDALRWNQEALRCAESVADVEKVKAFFPSLHLNLGKSLEDTGNRGEARRLYDLAGKGASELPDGRLTEMVRRGAADGLRRVLE
jgi:hypothetical protein